MDSAESSKSKTNEAWSGEFAAHFAKHCKPTIKFKAVSEKDVIKFCRENIKVEVLKRGDGGKSSIVIHVLLISCVHFMSHARFSLVHKLLQIQCGSY